MWKDGLHPDMSTWDKIIAKAEMIDSVVDPQERQHHQPGPSHDWTTCFINGSKNRHQGSGLASLAVRAEFFCSPRLFVT